MHHRTASAVLAIAALLVCATACGGSPAGSGTAGDSGGTGLAAPQGLTYGATPIVCTVGIPLTPVIPSSSGGAITS